MPRQHAPAFRRTLGSPARASSPQCHGVCIPPTTPWRWDTLPASPHCPGLTGDQWLQPRLSSEAHQGPGLAPYVIPWGPHPTWLRSPASPVPSQTKAAAPKPRFRGEQLNVGSHRRAYGVSLVCWRGCSGPLSSSDPHEHHLISL